MPWSETEIVKSETKSAKCIYVHFAPCTLHLNEYPEPENVHHRQSIMPGMKTKAIKEITRHKKDSVFNKFVKISEEFKKLEMERTWDSIPQHVSKQKPAGKRKSSD